MRAIRTGLVTLLLLALLGGGAYEWWSLIGRWQAHPITKDQAQIGKILNGSGWVSPGLGGPRLYMLAYRDCDACAAYAHSQFADLQAAGVDTRVIMIARDDLNGVPQSTAAERNTVAELWVNRSWALYRKWMDAPAASWTAPGVPAADGDVARSAVVEVGRDMVERLRPLLAENGIDLVYPVVIWQTKDGVLEGCACADPKAYGAVRKALGVQ